MEDGEPILLEEQGAWRVMTLNRPRVLNCLSLEMISKMADVFEHWENDNTVSTILIKGAGRAFCAGGDLRMFQSGRSDESWKEVVYKKYWMDFHLHTYRKPMVAIWDGVVVGGGGGFSLPSTFRIVTEEASFCMPEAALGFHTDCSGSYFLPRLPGRIGEYLGVTGLKLNSAEMLACGLATHFIPSQHIAEVERRVLGVKSPDEIKVVLEEFSRDNVEVPKDSALNRRHFLDKCFSSDSIEDMILVLEGEKVDKWLERVLRVLKQSSPTGLKQTLASIRRGRNASLRECLKQEYRLTLHCLRGTISEDLYEGIRAIIIDKDKKPKWKPSSLSEVSDEKLNLLFLPFKDEDELQLPAEGSTKRWTGKWTP